MSESFYIRFSTGTYIYPVSIHWGKPQSSYSFFWDRQRSSSAYLYNLLGALEAVPGWLELTLSGATQFEQGEGYLSSVGFCFDDVRRFVHRFTSFPPTGRNRTAYYVHRRLLDLLETLGSISSRSDTFRVNLMQRMTALGISTSNSTRTPLDAVRPLSLWADSSLRQSRPDFPSPSPSPHQ